MITSATFYCLMFITKRHNSHCFSSPDPWSPRPGKIKKPRIVALETDDSRPDGRRWHDLPVFTRNDAQGKTGVEYGGGKNVSSLRVAPVVPVMMVMTLRRAVVVMSGPIMPGPVIPGRMVTAVTVVRFRFVVAAMMMSRRLVVSAVAAAAIAFAVSSARPGVG